MIGVEGRLRDTCGEKRRYLAGCDASSGGFMRFCREAGTDGLTYLPQVNSYRRMEKEVGMRAPGSLMPVVVEDLMYSL